MTLIHESCDADEIVVTFENDVDDLQLHCKLLIPVLVTVNSTSDQAFCLPINAPGLHQYLQFTCLESSKLAVLS